MLVDLSGKPDAVALTLAVELSDAQFELLVRTRIRLQFEKLMHMASGNQLGESHNSCRFVYEWNDRCMWHIGIGSTYRDSVSIQGEVLTKTAHNALAQYNMQHGNKLSLLLPKPIEDIEDDDNI